MSHTSSQKKAASFIETASPVDTLSAEANRVLDVIAPATLPEGYTFEAEADGKTIMVTVPKDGVKEGEKFSVPFELKPNAYTEASVPNSLIPVGHWKDGLCACCGLGCCHPVLWNACCCQLILLGQVMHRLKLTWLANEGGSAAETASTFRIMFWIGIVVWILNYSLPQLPLLFINEYGQLTHAYFTAQHIVSIVLLAFAVFRIATIWKTRELIRNKYQIPSKHCGGCEDCCCAFWCSCCTVAQMARHTGDYETYQGMCCSETGLPSHAPPIV